MCGAFSLSLLVESNFSNFRFTACVTNMLYIKLNWLIDIPIANDVSIPTLGAALMVFCFKGKIFSNEKKKNASYPDLKYSLK